MVKCEEKPDVILILNMFYKFVAVSLFCVYVEGAFDLPEGSPCVWRGAEGQCVHLSRCKSFYYVKDEEEKPPICSFQENTPIICCVDCDILAPNDTLKNELDQDFYKTGRKYEEQCLLYQHLLPYACHPKYKRPISRIFDEKRKCFESRLGFGFAGGAGGGENALRGDFPHMALLGYGPELETAQWLCGGSLISEKHILTAAHCSSHPTLGPVTYVALGLLKRSDPPHYWKRYKVKLFYPHPEYQPPSKYHDIAIIETEPSVNLTHGVRPACLTHKLEFRGDDEAYATGWGSLGPLKENADVMQKVVLKKFTAEECASQYPAHRHLLRGYNHTTQVCYGDHSVFRDTCQGDSGGPLQKRDYDAKYCPYAIIGVTSSGHACGTPGQAGLYTRVSYYVPWIESLIWPN